MAFLQDFICENCGIDLVNDGRCFFYDSKTETTQDFLVLMLTAGIDEDAEIKGNVSETYCWRCKKFVRVYSICEVEKGIENACEIVENGINNYIDNKLFEINKLNEIKKRERYIVKKETHQFFSDSSEEVWYAVSFPEYEDGYEDYGGTGSVDEVIKNALDDFHNETDDVIDCYKKDVEAIYLVLDESERNKDYTPLEKVSCPKCGEKINKYINDETPCPRCGGKLILCGCMHAD